MTPPRSPGRARGRREWVPWLVNGPPVDNPWMVWEHVVEMKTASVTPSFPFSAALWWWYRRAYGGCVTC
jgi:hypothetical protein